jgi:MFS family permease
MLGIGFALIQITISPMLVHVIPALEDEGISRQAAGWAVTGFTLISVASRLAFGWLSDSFNKRWLLVIALALQVAGVLLFVTVHSAATLAPFIIVYGIGFGGGLPVRPAIQADYFGRTNFGTIQGAFITLSSVAAMASPIITGAIKDVSGDYDPAFIALGIGSACAAPLLLMAGPPVRRARRAA